MTAGAGICWLGTALLMAGIADAAVNRRAGSAIVIAAGIGALVVAFGLVRQAAGNDAVRRRGWWWIWVCEVAQVLVGAGRLALAVAAIGSPVDLSQALGLAVAPVAGSALGVLPGGLGVRETIAATIAALVAMPAAIGGAAAAVDRLLGLAVVAVLVPFGRKGTKAAGVEVSCRSGGVGGMSSNLRRAAVAAVLVASSALAGVVPADAAISTAAFCANSRPGTSGFDDIGDVAPAQRSDIECLALSGITSGTGPGTYSPRGTAFRDSMATFVAKLVDTANRLERTPLADLPASGPEAFTDDEQSVHEANINRLAAANIVRGKGPQTYGPNGAGNEVTRGQMATFLVAALDFLRPTPLPAGPDAFTDDDGHTHEVNINKLAAIDVVDGTAGSNYSPDARLSRAQMASFLIRALAFLESQGQIAPLPPSTQTIVLTPPGNVENGTDAAPRGRSCVHRCPRSPSATSTSPSSRART